MGNPTLVERPGSSKSPAWNYSPAFFSQVPDRHNATSQRWDVHEYDPLGRMTRWDEVDIDPAVLQPGDPSLVTRTFDYDGLGRVVRHTMDDDPGAAGLTSDTLLVYDADNQAVYEERTIDRWETITRWGGERIDWGTTGVAQDVTLQLLPMLRAQNGELRWVMADQSGAAFQIWESDGTELQFELGGVYGERLDDPTADWFHENPTVTTFGDWRLDGLHGSEPDRVRGLVHHGIRHSMLDDGRWLQPEPLLAVGATEPAIGTNYAMYAAGNPLLLADRNGLAPHYFEQGPHSGGGGGAGSVGGGGRPTTGSLPVGTTAGKSNVYAPPGPGTAPGAQVRPPSSSGRSPTTGQGGGRTPTRSMDARLPAAPTTPGSQNRGLQISEGNPASPSDVGSQQPSAQLELPFGQFRDGNGRLRNADGTFAYDGGPKSTSSTGGSTNGTHGNTAGDQPAELYKRYDKDGNFLKHGVSQDASKRYTKKELDGGAVIKTDQGPRREMLKKERALVETSPGPLNNEPWAGKRLGEDP